MISPAHTAPVPSVTAGSDTAREPLLTGLGPHLGTVTALALLYTVALAPAGGLEGTDRLHSAGLFAAGISATLILHEAAHALTATALGHRTPTVHLGWLGGHVLFPADISPRALLAAILAGPAVNLAAGAALAWAWLASGHTGLAGSTATTLAVAAVAGVNLLLGAFNLAPAPELDGAVALEAAAQWATGSRALARAATAVAGLGYGLALIFGPLLYGVQLARVVQGEHVDAAVAAAIIAYGFSVVHGTVRAARIR